MTYFDDSLSVCSLRGEATSHLYFYSSKISNTRQGPIKLYAQNQARNSGGVDFFSRR